MAGETTRQPEAAEGATATDHLQFLANVRDLMLPRLRADLDAARAELDDVLAAADPVDMLALAGFMYLPVDPNTYRESEHDRGSAHIEYLALQVLPFSADEPRPVHPGVAAHLAGAAIDVVRKMFDSQSMLIAASPADAPELIDDPATQSQVQARLESLSVRGSGYPEHLRTILEGTLGAFNAECIRLIGFSATVAFECASAMVRIVNDRLVPRVEAGWRHEQELLAALPRQRRKKVPGPVPDEIVALKPTEAKKRIAVLSQMAALTGARELATVTAAEIAAVCTVPEAHVEAFLDAFACDPGEFNPNWHRLPVGAHPLTSKPILKVHGGYMLAVPSSIVEPLRPRIEDLLRGAGDDRVWQRYLKHRSDWVDDEAVRRLTRALPGSVGHVRIPWRSSSDDSDIDGLVACDDVTFRVQGKAGRVQPAMRRGAPRDMMETLRALVREAAEQHTALAEALAQEGAAGIGLAEHAAALEGGPFQFEVIVVLDDLTVWSTGTHGLQDLGVLPADKPVPWVISLSDLMAVTDLLQGAQLIQYVVRRLRLETIGRVFAHDELDWAGNYLHSGLYFDDDFDDADAPDRVLLTTFTEDIDAWYSAREGQRSVPTEKPAQLVGPAVSELIERLATERPKHWVTASLALLMGDQFSREHWEQWLAHARRRRLSTGWSNATQTFHGSVGITYYMDFRMTSGQLTRQISDYAREKMQNEALPNWVAIGDGSGGLRVSLHGDDVRVFSVVF